MNSQVEVPLIKILKVEALPNFCLKATLQNGGIVNLDLSDLIQRREVYWRLKQIRYFQKVSVDPLGAICWPEGEDIAPENVLRYVRP